MKGFGSHKHLKFRPIHWLKYRLWRHNYVIVVTSETFLLQLCRIDQAWYLCQFSWSLGNNNKVMMGAPWLTVQKSLCQIRLRSSFAKNFAPPPGIRPSFSKGRELDQKLSGWPGFAHGNVFPGVPRGMHPAGVDWDIKKTSFPSCKEIS